MKKLLVAAFAALATFAAQAATLSPIQLLNPTGSVAGQVITSTGASTPPAWSTLSGIGALMSANNLSDLASTATARANLGLTTAATTALGTSGATIPLLSTANTWTLAQTFSGNVKVFAQNTSNSQTFATGVETVVTGWTAVTNVGSAFTASTGIFTAPVAGNYLVSVNLSSASATWSAPSGWYASIQKNGTDVVRNGWTVYAATTGSLRAPTAVAVVNCAANDTIKVAILQNGVAAGVALDSTAIDNTLSIVQVP